MANRSLKRPYNDPRRIFPTTLSFPNVQLDAKGCYELDFKDLHLILTKNTQVSLSELYVDMEYMHNVIKDTRYVETTDWASSSSSSSSSSTPTKKPGKYNYDRFSKSRWIFKSETDPTDDKIKKFYYPTSRVASVSHLVRLLDFVLSDKKIRFLCHQGKNEMVWMADSKCQSISIDVRTARCLGLLRTDGSIPHLALMLKPAELTFTLTERLRIARKNDGKEIKMHIPTHKDTIIWNYISDQSFQEMIASVDIMKTQFTGTTLTKTLATIPVRPEVDKLVYNPWSAHWTDVETGSKNKIKLSFHDATGKAFSHLPLTFVLKFRKKIVA